MLGSLRDLTPILLVVAFFQLVVLQQPIPDLFNLVVGILLVILGLSFFIFGLEWAYSPSANLWPTRLRRRVALPGYYCLLSRLGTRK